MSRILVVDDAALFRHLICNLLASHGYETVPAENGLEALRILGDEKFDLMISDISMQPMDGMELLDQVQEFISEMSVIMLTASESINTAVVSMKKGVFDYLTKPVDPSVLLRTVRRALDYKGLPLNLWVNE